MLLFDHFELYLSPTIATSLLGKFSVEDEKIQLLEREERPIEPLFLIGKYQSVACERMISFLPLAPPSN